MLKLNLNLSPHLKKLELFSKSSSTNQMIGSYKSFFKGSGIEFEEYLEFEPGSDAAKIDWIASSRTNKLLIKSFAEERNITSFILFDTSSSMLYSSSDKMKCEYSAEFIATLAFSIISSKDLVGLGLFNNDIKKIITPSTGEMTYFKIIEALKNESYYGGQKNYNISFSKINKLIKDNCILFIISDYINFYDTCFEHLKTLGHNFEIIAIMIRDPVEIKIPDNLGLVCFEDPFTNKQLIADLSNVSEEYNIEVGQEIKSIEEKFLENEFDFYKIYMDKPVDDQIMELFKQRRQRWK